MVSNTGLSRCKPLWWMWSTIIMHDLASTDQRQLFTPMITIITKKLRFASCCHITIFCPSFHDFLLLRSIPYCFQNFLSLIIGDTRMLCHPPEAQRYLLKSSISRAFSKFLIPAYFFSQVRVLKSCIFLHPRYINT